MPTSTGDLLKRAMEKAVAYRDAVAADPQPPSIDYHGMRERVSSPLPITGTTPSLSSMNWRSSLVQGLRR